MRKCWEKKKRMRTFLDDYSMQESSEIDMRIGDSFIVPRQIDLPENFQSYIGQYPTKALETNVKSKLSEIHSINEKNIIIGAGANGIMQNLIKMLFKNKGELLASEFSFEQPEFAVSSIGGTVKKIKNHPDFSNDFKKLTSSITNATKAVFLCNPNNPTGIYEDPNEIIKLAKSTNIPIIVSEAGIEYTKKKSLLNYNLPKNLIVLRTFSKAYGLSGLRVGYAYMDDELITLYKENTPQFEVSSLSLLLAERVLGNESMNENVDKIIEQREFIRKELTLLGIKTTQSESNCFMSEKPYDNDFYEKLTKHGISVVEIDCDCNSEYYFRIAVQEESKNQEFINRMKKIR